MRNMGPSVIYFVDLPIINLWPKEIYVSNQSVAEII